MDNKTSDDTGTLETEVREAVEKGLEVQERVRQITLRMIRGRSFDIKSLQRTTGAVLRGARRAVEKEMQQSSGQSKVARERLKEAVTGLDLALAQFAEAAKLAVEEAAGRAKKYSKKDLTHARADLERLESMFVDSLQKSASAAKDAAGDILSDLAAHARTNGSAVGAQMKETLDVIAHQLGATGRAQAEAGLHLAQNTSDFIRQIAAGVLTGLAEHVKPGHPGGKGK
ncbi:MAG: hypothetical protein LAN71_16600 [Acidobacteriia bacterium]|nr:hypothetical protein [Terriglobia bacterium]